MLAPYGLAFFFFFFFAQKLPNNPYFPTTVSTPLYKTMKIMITNADRHIECVVVNNVDRCERGMLGLNKLHV